MLPPFFERRTSACEIVRAVSAVFPSASSTKGPIFTVTAVDCLRNISGLPSFVGDA
jgi:hypothetical protein